MQPDAAVDENGNAISLVETERYRALHSYLYAGYQDGSVGNHGYGLNNDKTKYTLMRWWLSEPYVMGNQNAVAWVQNGDYIDCVPLPKMNAEDEDQSFFVNFVYFLRPADTSQKDAKTVKAAYELIDMIYTYAAHYQHICSGGAYPIVGEGIVGATEWTRNWVAKMTADLEVANAEITALLEYDAEWIATLANYYNTAPIHFRSLKLPGVNTTNGICSNDAFANPTATFIAQYAPVHQAQCDAFNLLYAD